MLDEGKHNFGENDGPVERPKGRTTNIKEVKNITTKRTVFINNEWPKNGRQPIRDHKSTYALA